MKQLLAAISMVLVASAASAEGLNVTLEESETGTKYQCNVDLRDMITSGEIKNWLKHLETNPDDYIEWVENNDKDPNVWRAKKACFSIAVFKGPTQSYIHFNEDETIHQSMTVTKRATTGGQTGARLYLETSSGEILRLGLHYDDGEWNVYPYSGENWSEEGHDKHEWVEFITEMMYEADADSHSDIFNVFSVGDILTP